MADSIIESVEKVSLVIARYCKAEEVFYGRQTEAGEESTTSLIRLYCRIIEYQVDLQTYSQRSIFGNLLRAIPSMDDFSKSCSKIDEADRECQRYFSVLNADVIRQMSVSIEGLLSKAEWAEKLQILDWISTATSSDTHNYLLQNAKMGSEYRNAGEWLFEHRSFLKWSQCTPVVGPPLKAQCLWLHGPAGTGKSSVTARLIERLLEDRCVAKKEIVAFFYCLKDQLDQSSNQSDIVLRGILRQLAWCPDGGRVQSTIWNAYKRKRMHNSSLKGAECVKLLEEAILPYGKVTIVVDALDECAQTQELLLHLADLYSKAEGRLRLFFSGRDNVRIPRRFDYFEIEISETDTSADLIAFVHCETIQRQFYHDDLFEECDAGRSEEKDARYAIEVALSQYGKGM